MSSDDFTKMVVRSGIKEYGLSEEKLNEDDPFFIYLCERIDELTAIGHSYGGAFEIALAERFGGGVNPEWDEVFKS